MTRIHPRRSILAFAMAAGLGLGLAGAARAQEQTPPPPQSPADLPDGGKLVAAAMQKLGGKETLAKVKSFSCNLESEMFAQGEESIESITLISILPEKYKMSATTTSGDTAEFVTNGKHAWSREPGGDEYNLEDIAEASAMLTMMAPQGLVLTLHTFPTAKTLGAAALEGKEAYRIEVSSSDGKKKAVILINQESGELAGFEHFSEDMGATMTLAIREWKDVDGVKMITRSGFDFGFGDMAEINYSNYKLNEVTESEFAVPDPVKKAIDEEEGDDGGGG